MDKMTVSPKLGAIADQRGIKIQSWAGWDHAQSAVWRAKSKDGMVVVKEHRHGRKFHQEVQAYRQWVSQLADVPVLLEVYDDGVLRFIVISHCKGELVLNGDVTADIAHAAGQWLRCLHTLPVVDRDFLNLYDALSLRIDRVVSASDLATETVQAVSDLKRCFEDVEEMVRVPCHRDYTPRNWLWDGSCLSIIDFEHCRLDWWLLDCERFLNDFSHDNLVVQQAFWHGYGREPTAAEWRALDFMQGIQALSTIQWGENHADPAFAQQGRQKWQLWSSRLLDGLR